MTGLADGHLVVDASVALKWALDDEQEVDSALTLLEDGIRGRFRLLAPSLWLYEVLNGLVVAARRGRIPDALAAEALELLLGVGVRLADPEAAACFDVARRFELSAHDAAYLALAEAIDARVWTGDRRLCNRMKGETERVCWIGDYPG